MKKQKGFSLIELLIVVGIIGTLTAIAVPAYTAQKDKSTVTAALASLKALLSGAALAIEDGDTIADYIKEIDGNASTTTYVIEKVGTIEDATTAAAGNNPAVNAMKVTIADGTFTDKTITYTQKGTIWACEYDKLITDITLPGCKASQ
ncbi:type IV pilin protein [Enterovibrio norvegicus]|uniref:type IV pilin protein n=1 Tax=Enterovibrio norvegicus TaxID=188144 RepID=UPI00389B1F2F